ncbi:hypothetical protein, partial [Demequina mangrovi]
MDDPLEPQLPGDSPAEAAPEQAPNRRRLGWTVAASCAVVALVGIVGWTVASDRDADTDGDGLTDRVETSGWHTAGGAVHVTDPDVADTDGDGLADGVEAGAVVSGSGVEAVFEGVSDPTRADSDGDGLGDGSEVLGWADAAGAMFVT